MANSCVPDNKVAKLILASCAAAFAANSDDCNKFLKAALSDFLSEGYLNNLIADDIVGKLRRKSEGWKTSQQDRHGDRDGKIGEHGRGRDNIRSARAASRTPRCRRRMQRPEHRQRSCAGRLCRGAGNPPRAHRRRQDVADVEAHLVHSEGLDYYFKPPDRTPA